MGCVHQGSHPEVSASRLADCAVVRPKRSVALSEKNRLRCCRVRQPDMMCRSVPELLQLCVGRRLLALASERVRRRLIRLVIDDEGGDTFAQLLGDLPKHPLESVDTRL